MNDINIKNPSENISTAKVLARLTDSIRIRYQIAVLDLTQKEIDIRSVEWSMRIVELQACILKLLRWVAFTLMI